MTAVPAEANVTTVLGPPGPGTATATGAARPMIKRPPRPAVLASVFWNPIVAKELRSRMQGWHAAALLTGYLSVIGGLGYLVYSSAVSNSYSVLQAGTTGSDLFKALAAAVMVTVTLVVPGLVGPALSGERERQTLELLLVTPVRPARIVIGKLVAALAFVVFLVVACVPLFSVVFLLGGVTLSLLVETLAFTLVTAFSLGSLCMLASAALRRVSAATVVSYLAMLALTIGPLIGSYGLYRAFSSTTYPSVGGATIQYGLGAGGSVQVSAISPVIGAAGLLSGGPCANWGWVGYSPIGVAPFTSCGQSTSQTSLGPLGTWPTWAASSVFDGAIALGALGGSIVVLRRRSLS